MKMIKNRLLYMLCFGMVGGLGVSDSFADKLSNNYIFQSDIYVYDESVKAMLRADNSTDVYAWLQVAVNKTHYSNDIKSPFITSEGSLLGIRGLEKMDDGSLFLWQMESSLDLSNRGDETLQNKPNNSLLGSRDSFVALDTTVGMFLAGKQATPYKFATRGWDPFEKLPGDFRSYMGNISGFKTNIDSNNAMYNLRAPNTVAYMTPEFSDVRAMLAVAGISQQDNDNAKAPIISLNLRWQYDAVEMVYAFEKHSGLDYYQQTPFTAKIDIPRSRAHLGGLKWHDDHTQFSAIAELITVDNNREFNNWKRFSWNMALTHNIAKESFRLGFGYAGVFFVNDAAKLISVAWMHSFAKSTQLYVSLSNVQNETLGEYSTYRANSIIDNDPTTYAVGLIHRI